MLKQLLEPLKKLEELFKSEKQNRLILEEDLNDGMHVTRITGLRSLFVSKMGPHEPIGEV